VVGQPDAVGGLVENVAGRVHGRSVHRQDDGRLAPTWVAVAWDDEGLAIPLSQLEVVDADDETREAVEDWLYWTKKGYQF